MQKAIIALIALASFSLFLSSGKAGPATEAPRAADGTVLPAGFRSVAVAVW